MTAHAPKYSYDHGLPFSEDLGEKVIKPLLTDLNREPAIIVIDGTAGTGKTTLAVEIADYVNSLDGKGEVNLMPSMNVQLGHGGADLTERSEVCSKDGYRVFIFDEADFEKKGAMTRYNRGLHKFFREYRSMKILIILVIQSVAWLDNTLYDGGLVKCLIHLSNPLKNYTSYEVYDLENLSWLIDRMDRLGRYRRRKAYSINRGFLRGQFLPLPPARSEQLRALSDSFKAASRKKTTKRLKKEED